jgi:hypothetical protein
MDDGCEIAAASRNQRLMHMQGDGKRALDAAEINPAVRLEDWLVATGAQG